MKLHTTEDAPVSRRIMDAVDAAGGKQKCRRVELTRDEYRELLREWAVDPDEPGAFVTVFYGVPLAIDGRLVDDIRRAELYERSARRPAEIVPFHAVSDEGNDDA